MIPIYLYIHVETATIPPAHAASATSTGSGVPGAFIAFSRLTRELESSWIRCYTLQGTNISHLGKRKIIFRSGRGYDTSKEGNCTENTLKLQLDVCYLYLCNLDIFFWCQWFSCYFVCWDLSSGSPGSHAKRAPSSCGSWASSPSWPHPSNHHLMIFKDIYIYIYLANQILKKALFKRTNKTKILKHQKTYSNFTKRFFWYTSTTNITQQTYWGPGPSTFPAAWFGTSVFKIIACGHSHWWVWRKFSHENAPKSDTPWKFNSSPPKIIPKGKKSSNHHFSGASC